MPIRPPSFRPAHVIAAQEAGHSYDRDRGSARKRGYDGRWDKDAKLFKFQHPLCLGCEAIGHIVPTVVVDHTIPHKGDRSLFNDTDNRQPSCVFHHSVVKQALEQLYAQGKVSRDDLRLDSAKAIEITRELMPRG